MAELDGYFAQYFDDGFHSYTPERKEIPSLENFITRNPSLWDHLNWQANLTFFDPEDKKTAEVIIGNINEDGYLTLSEEEAASAAGADLDRVRKVRAMIRMFDPVGVASLDLKEALMTQMDHLNLANDITRSIITQHLPLLEKSDYLQLSRLLGIPLTEVKYHMEVIKRLDPAPGRRYSRSTAMPRSSASSSPAVARYFARRV